MRRVKVFGLLVFIFVISVLFYTASLRAERDQDPRTVGDFYAKTMNALDNQNPNLSVDVGAGSRNVDGIEGEDEEVARQMALRLKEAAQVAKDKANAKAPKPDPPSAVIGKGNAAELAGGEKAVAGRKKYTTGEGTEVQAPVKDESTEVDEVKVELDSIMKKSPSKCSSCGYLAKLRISQGTGLTVVAIVIIFSKSYCPHSRRAKGILLDKYIIEPAPFVVELDRHPLGAKLQARLAELTGRRTVPNTLINGVSIGGGDDVAELDSTKNLTKKIKDLGGKRIVDVREKPSDVEEGSHGLR